MILQMQAIAGSLSVEEAFSQDAESTYTVPSIQEMKQMADMFEQAWNEKLAQNLMADQPFTMIDTGQDQLFVGNKAVQGVGRYIINQEQPTERPVLLMTPHRYYDLRTGHIALQLYQQRLFAGWAFNNSSRRLLNADMAHSKASYFLSFAASFWRAYPQGTIVQLHGFAPEKRNTRYARNLDLIVSSGSRMYGPRVKAIYECLSKKTEPEKTALFGLQINELGATTNNVAGLSRVMGKTDSFVHIEMSPAFRKQVEANPSILSDCLVGGR